MAIETELDKNTKVAILSQGVVDYIENLRKLTGRQRQEDVFIDALVLYDWALRRRDDGYKVCAYKKTDNGEEVYQPDLETLSLE